MFTVTQNLIWTVNLKVVLKVEISQMPTENNNSYILNIIFIVLTQVHLDCSACFPSQLLGLLFPSPPHTPQLTSSLCVHWQPTINNYNKHIILHLNISLTFQTSILTITLTAACTISCTAGWSASTSSTGSGSDSTVVGSSAAASAFSAPTASAALSSTGASTFSSSCSVDFFSPSLFSLFVSSSVQ